MKATELRKKFLEFFASKDHFILPSHSLIPNNDPTLLWINCGMAPLKDYYAKRAVPPSPRMANCQKSLRTNDIEHVGKTARHNTMFEMLGNFSIGDYFKEEAITWAWEFLVDVLGMDKEKLYVTIHPDDEEAFEIWHKKIGLAPERIFRDPDNFWEIGPGPCGPNSEIFVDRGPKYGCGQPNCTVGCDCDRYLEIWNLVFTQYNRETDGSLTDLPYKNIDTGMGLERLASVMQDTETNYETDLFWPIIEEVQSLCGVPYAANKDATTAYRVIADHVRSVTFAIADGAMPSNEGRGYVIRRLLRRAVRYGRHLGLSEPFLHTLVAKVVEIMGDHYDYLGDKQELVERVVLVEERRFLATLDEGMELLYGLLEDLKSQGKQLISGKDAFRLYDTFGFPLDLTVDIAAEEGFKVNTAGFHEAMEEQRARARAARSGIEGNAVAQHPFDEVEGGHVFVGYETLKACASVLALAHEGELVNEASAGTTVELLVSQTPFYATAGGQVADTGYVCNENCRLKVIDVNKLGSGKIVHKVRVEDGTVLLNDEVTLTVDPERRQRIARHHTATHLLHQALRNVLGDHVQQSGSLVSSEKLRFDFSHFEALTPAQLEQVENEVNRIIMKSLPVNVKHMSLKEAREQGAIALFDEKYGNQVRVVEIGEYSKELCGGTHMQNSAQVGMFVILSESSIGSGIRRIEAAAGPAAYQYVTDLRHRLNALITMLKCEPGDAEQRLEGLIEQNRELSRENERLRSKLASSSAEALLQQVIQVDGISVLAARVEAGDMEALRTASDAIAAKVSDAVIVLGAVYDNKVGLVAKVSQSLVKERRLHAGNLIREVARLCGGGGGGRPDMAQAGGRDPEKLPAALQRVPELVRQQLQQK